MGRVGLHPATGMLCYNIANDLPITVNDSFVELDLLFIDDLIEEAFDALEWKEHHCEFDGISTVFIEDGGYCAAPVTHKVTLGYIVECLNRFHDQAKTLLIPTIAPGSFEKKLYSMYLNYLPKEKVAFDIDMKCDDRGSFTELIKTFDHGQFSVNISEPSVTKGQHWHNSRWDFFIVVSGHGLIQERKV
jgi:UDP-2-acetamido-2,6-beta-L-arabino-hexul-4-ose reductase